MLNPHFGRGARCGHANTVLPACHTNNGAGGRATDGHDRVAIKRWGHYSGYYLESSSAARIFLETRSKSSMSLDRARP